MRSDAGHNNPTGHNSSTRRDGFTWHDAPIGYDGSAGRDSPVRPNGLTWHDGSIGHDGSAGHDGSIGHDGSAGRDSSAGHDGMTRARSRLLHLVDDIRAWDDLERSHQDQARAWVRSGAPIWRIAKPAVPDPHLVSYFVVLDETTFDVLLVDHRRAGRWLPPGGHVEPGEDPWHTVVRECEEELGVVAAPSKLAGDRPFFISVSRTVPPGSHTDVSLWYVITLERSAAVEWDAAEFAGIRWVPVEQLLEEAPDTLDPQLPRCAAKLLDARTSVVHDHQGTGIGQPEVRGRSRPSG